MFCAEADDSPLEVKYFLNTCRTLKEEPALASFNGSELHEKLTDVLQCELEYFLSEDVYAL